MVAQERFKHFYLLFFKKQHIYMFRKLNKIVQNKVRNLSNPPPLPDTPSKSNTALTSSDLNPGTDSEWMTKSPCGAGRAQPSVPAHPQTRVAAVPG